ncbi:MAG: hypothetical protein EG822_16405 [Deltaproteobacteria bacterium]|nr:hypothetical protein [Deltaproteobacteria bacterium]TLN00970.1 MAG: hypothetical protein FDZ73_17675 [bacterium]
MPRCVVIDNLKSGVSRSCRYELVLNATYASLAEHYQTAVVPALPTKSMTLPAVPLSHKRIPEKF